MMPAVRSPNSAGKAPVSRLMLCAKRGLDNLAEPGDTFRQLNPVYPVLKIGMVAAHVKLAKRILHHAGCLKEHLVESRYCCLAGRS